MMRRLLLNAVDELSFLIFKRREKVKVTMNDLGLFIYLSYLPPLLTPYMSLPYFEGT